MRPDEDPDHRRRRLRRHTAGAGTAPPRQPVRPSDRIAGARRPGRGPPRAAVRSRGCESRVGPLLDQCTALRSEPFDGVFHLASAVSGECESRFRARPAFQPRQHACAARRAARPHRSRARHATRLVFSSSVAVFGPDPAHPLPEVVGDDTLPAPQTSYGTHKLICEHLVADYTRKGYIDGRSARLMTVTVRPGRPNGAASSFFSGIIREPLAGEEAILPVVPGRLASGVVTAPHRRGADRGVRGQPRRLRRPQCLEPAGAQRDRAADARCARDGGRPGGACPGPCPSATSALPASSPTGRVPRARERAARLGLHPEASFEDIIREYIADQADCPRRRPALERRAPSPCPHRPATRRVPLEPDRSERPGGRDHRRRTGHRPRDGAAFSRVGRLGRDLGRRRARRSRRPAGAARAAAGERGRGRADRRRGGGRAAARRWSASTSWSTTPASPAAMRPPGNSIRRSGGA